MLPKPTEKTGGAVSERSEQAPPVFEVGLSVASKRRCKIVSFGLFEVVFMTFLIIFASFLGVLGILGHF